MNLISIKDSVKEILTNEPETRDNDNLLILKVWAKQNPFLRRKEVTFLDFAVGFKGGQYASTESVRRCRQKLQELNPSLRGKNYKKRHDEQASVKDQLNNFGT